MAGSWTFVVSADCLGMGTTENALVEAADVFRLVNVCVSSLQTESDLDCVRGRLSAIERLGSADYYPHRYRGSLDLASSVMVAFVAYCQHQPSLWAWCKRVCREAGLDAVTIANDVQSVVPTGVSEWYLLPVPVFGSRPDCYVSVPVSELPYMHVVKGCGQADRLSAIQAEVRVEAAGPWFRRVRRALSPPERTIDTLGEPDRGRAVAEQEAGRRFDDELRRGVLEPCSLHGDVDWPAVLAAAADLHESVRPWERAAVGSAALGWPGFSHRERVELQDLFLDPIRWDGTSSTVNGGQHRLCQIRRSAATTVMVGYGSW